ncbi:MAG: right-handed parallel beta-helix repeat-containing protein [Bacteroidota bacterium]
MKLLLHGLLCILLFLYWVSCSPTSQYKVYYISPDGSDQADGLSPSSPWRSLAKLNETVFQPGEQILLKKDGVWQGNLQPQGNGQVGLPILLSSYGSGAPPVINIGEEGVGIELINQSCWEIAGIEVTSGAPHKLDVRRNGIMAIAKGETGKVEHIVIRDCYIHDMWGQVGGDKSGIAIYVGERILGPQQKYNCPTNDVLIENNRIERMDKVGIAVNGDDGIVIRGNHMDNLGGDGIVLIGANKGLIEYNIADRTCMRSGDLDLDTGGEDWWPHTAAIWLWKNTETVMQFNEVYNTGRQPANGDGEAFDFDFECKKCVLQYNYSRNNKGFLLIMDNTYQNVARYNVSENDQTHLINMFCDTSEQNLIHNNVFYVDYGTVDIDYFYGDSYGPEKGKGKKDISKLGAQFRNNIFYASGQGRFRRVYSHGDSLNSALYRKYDDHFPPPPSIPGTKFYGNCYYGPWLNGMPDDPKALLADPMLVAAGTGETGLHSVGGYQLQPNSPCISAGLPVHTPVTHDYFGNSLADERLDIGVHQFSTQ